MWELAGVIRRKRRNKIHQMLRFLRVQPSVPLGFHIHGFNQPWVWNHQCIHTTSGAPPVEYCHTVMVAEVGDQASVGSEGHEGESAPTAFLVVWG